MSSIPSLASESAAAPAPPAKLTRYKDLALLFLKLRRTDDAASAGDAHELTDMLERMGPTFVKLGQLLSTRADLLPQTYLDALARLQDDVAPIDTAAVQQIVSDELGVRLSKAFLEFDPQPLAAASLAQVHRATLRDGREVAVKVQRPGVRERVTEDLDILEQVAGWIDRHTKAGEHYHFVAMIDEFRKSLMVELDYKKEASNLITLRENLEEFPSIVVPEPVIDYTTSRVLTMDYLRGTKITEISPLTLMELDRDKLADELFDAYLRQIFQDGFFHADPHPGNVLLTDEGRIALIDVGMVARLAPRLQEHLLQMTIAISEERPDEAADLALRIASPGEQVDERLFRSRVAELVGSHQGATLDQLQIGTTFVSLGTIAGETGVRLPPELTMLGKTLLNLDIVGRTLAPDFDPNRAIRRHTAKLMNRYMLKSLSPGHLLGAIIETKDFVSRLPSRLNRVLDAVADNKIGVKVDTGLDPAQVVLGMQKVANRIALGLVLAALIVGAALLMQIPTTFRIFGYPGLAMLFFLLAAGTGSFLLIHSLLHDLRSRRAATKTRDN